MDRTGDHNVKQYKPTQEGKYCVFLHKQNLDLNGGKMEDCRNQPHRQAPTNLKENPRFMATTVAFQVSFLEKRKPT
jgi:hypothetical protein